MQGWRTSSSCKPWWKFTLTGELTWHEGRRNQTSWKKTGTGHLGLSCCEPTVLIPLLQLCSDKHQRLHRPKMESLLFLFRLAGPVFYEQSRRLHIKLPPLPYFIAFCRYYDLLIIFTNFNENNNRMIFLRQTYLLCIYLWKPCTRRRITF